MVDKKTASIGEGFWALVDLFGHTRVAGFLSETTIGGCAFVRVDTPAVEDSMAVTHLYGNGAIYSITPVSEEVVRLFVQRYKPEPISVYMPEIKQIASKPERPVGAGLDDDEYEYR